MTVCSYGKLDLRGSGDFYGLCWALRLASEALDAVGLPHGIRPLLAAGCLCPVVKADGADADAHAVANADIPINCDVGSVDAQFARAYGRPGFVSVVFSRNFSFGLKIRVYRQKIHHS